MKTIVYLFAFLAMGYAFSFDPSESDNEEEILIPVLTEEDFSPEQLQCIQNAVNQIINENPQLDWWFEIVKKSHQRIVKKAEKCKELEDPDNQRKCLVAVTIILKAENLRLILILPKDQRKIVEQINRSVKNCLNIREIF